MLICSNQYKDAKRYKVHRYYLPKGIIKNYNVMVNGKNFYDQVIDYDTKRYEEIRKSKTDHGEDLNQKMFVGLRIHKNPLKTDCSWLESAKKLDADLKAIEQIEIIDILKN